MSLIAQFSDEFDGAIRHRGADYFLNSRVRLDSATVMRINTMQCCSNED